MENWEQRQEDDLYLKGTGMVIQEMQSCPQKGCCLPGHCQATPLGLQHQHLGMVLGTL